jgi:hypothetical protein
MICHTSYGQGRESVFSCNAADVRVNASLHRFTDDRPTLGRTKYNMNQTANVTVRHGFSRPFLDSYSFSIYPSTSSAVPNRAGLLSFAPAGLRSNPGVTGLPRILPGNVIVQVIYRGFMR